MRPRLPGNWNRCHENCDDGFSLVELVVAMFIIGGVLLSLVTLQTKAMVTIAQAKERQQATAIANEILEQLRALPWQSVTAGAYTYEVGPYVSGNTMNIPDESFEPETLIERENVIASDDPAAGSPLDGIAGTNRTIHTDPAIPGFEFTAYSFVTQKTSGVAEPYNLTVVVEWTPRGKAETRKVVARTTAFNTRSGCGNSETRPYASACQDFFTTQASASAPSLSVIGAPIVDEDESPEPGPYEILPGSGVSEISTSGVSVGVAIDAAQSAKVRGNVNVGAISRFDLDRNDTKRFHDGVSVTASDSVTSGDEQDSSGSMDATDLGIETISGGGMELVVTPGVRGGDAMAKTTEGCGPWASTSHPCGKAVASNGKQTVVLTIGDETIKLAELDQVTITAQSARFPGGTAVAGSPSHCVAATLVGSGCAEVEASTSPFTALFEGVGVLTNHAPTSSAGRGATLTTHNSNPSRGGPFSISTTASDWSSIPNMAPATITESRTVSPIVIRDTGNVVVTADAAISIVPYNVQNETQDPECRSEACTGRETVDAVRVDITYHVKHGSTEVAFTLSASLGDTHVSASYKASPKAWENAG